MLKTAIVALFWALVKISVWVSGGGAALDPLQHSNGFDTVERVDRARIHIAEAQPGETQQSQDPGKEIPEEERKDGKKEEGPSRPCARTTGRLCMVL